MSLSRSRAWRCAALVLGGLLAASGASAAEDPAEFSYRQRLGARLPLSVELHEAEGGATRLGALAGGVPLVLALGYFHCPNLCGVVRDDLFHALDAAALVPGRDYALAAISIDPTETAADARAAKTADLAQYDVPGAGSAWHYLTGTATSVQAVADAVGFRDRLDTRTKQFLHPAGVVVATASGVVSAYLLGVGYTPTDLRAAVARAGAGGVAEAASPVLLLCFHFDPQTGRYTLAVEKLLRLAAGLTVLTLGGTLLLAFSRGRRS